MDTELIEWQRIKAEVAQCQDISIMSKLSYTLEAIQKWAKQSKQGLETQNEIAEYRLRLNRKQGEWIEANIPQGGGNPQLTNFSRLEDVGIDRNDSPKFRVLARIPEERFNSLIKQIKEQGELTTNEVCHAFNKNIASKWTGEHENYTPAPYIEAARSVMGSIDCDPASNELAQKIVRAAIYYTPETDGLTQAWSGNIFLNPPYSHPEVVLFIDKLLGELKDGQQAILLTNNNTDTSFFHKAVRVASAVCFTKGRINFYKEDMTITSPTNGQVFFYFGNNTQRFVDYFSGFGTLMRVL